MKKGLMFSVLTIFLISLVSAQQAFVDILDKLDSQGVALFLIFGLSLAFVNIALSRVLKGEKDAFGNRAPNRLVPFISVLIAFGITFGVNNAGWDLQDKVVLFFVFGISLALLNMILSRVMRGSVNMMGQRTPSKGAPVLSLILASGITFAFYTFEWGGDSLEDLLSIVGINEEFVPVVLGAIILFGGIYLLIKVGLAMILITFGLLMIIGSLFTNYFQETGTALIIGIISLLIGLWWWRRKSKAAKNLTPNYGGPTTPKGPGLFRRTAGAAWQKGKGRAWQRKQSKHIAKQQAAQRKAQSQQQKQAQQQQAAQQRATQQQSQAQGQKDDFLTKQKKAIAQKKAQQQVTQQKEAQQPVLIFKEVEQRIHSLPEEDQFDWKEIFELFHRHDVKDVEIKFPKINEDKIRKILVEEHNFSSDRVEKQIGRLKDIAEKQKQTGLGNWV